MIESFQVGQTAVRLVQGDITEQKVDAIVNAANTSLLGGGGVDGAIHLRGGPTILEACRRIRESTHPHGLPTGEAVSTTAGKLAARRVVHTVGPVWPDCEEQEAARLLANAYRNSLRVAAEEGLRTVAFPSISTGAYAYPVARAARVALHTVREELRAHPDRFDEVRFVLFSQRDFEEYRAASVEMMRA